MSESEPDLKTFQQLIEETRVKRANAIDPLDSEKVVFGYRFGKLSLAIAPADKPRKPSAAVSLADFIGKR